MKIAKHLALLLALLQLLLLLAACNGQEPEPTASTPSTTTTTTAAATTTTTVTPSDEPTEPLCIIAEGKAQYQLVTSVSAAASLTNLVREFNNQLEELTGTKLDVIPDTYLPESDCEIVIGGRKNRPDAAEVEATTAYTGYQMATSGERILLWAYRDTHYETLLEDLLDQLYNEDGCWFVNPDELNYEQNTMAVIDAPKFATANGYVQGGGSYLSAANTVTVTYENTQQAEWDAYVQLLKQSGYTSHAENTLGTVLYHTLVKENYTVLLQYQPARKITTLTYLKDQYIPAATPAAYDEEARSSVNFLKRYGHNQWGLSIILQLADGTFMIVDGGKSDTADRNNMINFMKENKPASHEKPIVSLWMITHPHEDHAEMFVYEAATFSQEIELKLLGYNFPITPCSETDANGHYWASYYLGVEEKRARFFPDTEVWYMHSGQKLCIADAEVDVLYTHEDYYPNAIYSANDCNTSVRVTVDGKTLLILGDNHNCNPDLYATYQGTMQADIVQIAHHGSFGLAEMYEEIDAKIALWPTNDTATQECMDYAMHKGWLAKQWTREVNGSTVTGDRQHYTASHTTRIYFDEL